MTTLVPDGSEKAGLSGGRLSITVQNSENLHDFRRGARRVEVTEEQDDLLCERLDRAACYFLIVQAMSWQHTGSSLRVLRLDSLLYIPSSTNAIYKLTLTRSRGFVCLAQAKAVQDPVNQFGGPLFKLASSSCLLTLHPPARRLLLYGF